MNNFISQNLNDAGQVLSAFLKDEKNLEHVSHAIDRFSETLKNNGRILSCGNGGSMCDSMHFAEELTGRFRKDRMALCVAACFLFFHRRNDV